MKEEEIIRMFAHLETKKDGVSIKRLSEISGVNKQIIYQYARYWEERGYVKSTNEWRDYANKEIKILYFIKFPETIETLKDIINNLNKVKRSTGNRGLYFLYDDIELVYIGQSNDIRQRLTQHGDKYWTHYSIYPLKDYKKRIAFEKRLIREYQPEYNIMNNKNYD